MQVIKIAVIDFNNFESGTQMSGTLDMSIFHKISITKCSHRNLLDFTGLDLPIAPSRKLKYAK